MDYLSLNAAEYLLFVFCPSFTSSPGILIKGRSITFWFHEIVAGKRKNRFYTICLTVV